MEWGEWLPHPHPEIIQATFARYAKYFFIERPGILHAYILLLSCIGLGTIVILVPLNL
jgi:hypothetical protein